MGNAANGANPRPRNSQARRPSNATANKVAATNEVAK